MYTNIYEDELSELEKKTIAHLDTICNGYNSTSGGEGSSGFRHTEESKRKMSKSSKGQFVSEETRRKLSKIRKGKKKSKEHIKKIKQSNIGKLAGENHPNYGKNLDQSIIDKIILTKRKKFIRNIVVYSINGNLVGEWNSVAKCVADLNLQQPNVWKCLNGMRKSHKGYVFKDKMEGI